jgi:hypothetical protein
MLKVPVETPASPPNSAGISDAAREGDRTVASDSKIFRDEAARVLREARRAPPESQRNIFIEISATYKRLALDEERLRGEPLRSRERVTSDNAIQSAAARSRPHDGPKPNFLSSIPPIRRYAKPAFPSWATCPGGRTFVFSTRPKGTCLTQRPPISQPDWRATSSACEWSPTRSQVVKFSRDPFPGPFCDARQHAQNSHPAPTGAR